jgi:hypothetical protein
MPGRIWYEGSGLAILGQAVYVEIDFKWDRRNLWQRVEPTLPTKPVFSLHEGVGIVRFLYRRIETCKRKA